MITDIDTNELINISSGEFITTRILNITKGESGTPGKIQGTIDNQKNIGTISKNTKFGIYGKVTIPIDNLNDDSTVIVGLDYSLASQDQYEAASLARFKPAPISGGIEIYCNGVKPNIDIPASIIIMGVD